MVEFFAERSCGWSRRSRVAAAAVVPPAHEGGAGGVEHGEPVRHGSVETDAATGDGDRHDMHDLRASASAEVRAAVSASKLVSSCSSRSAATVPTAPRPVQT